MSNLELWIRLLSFRYLILKDRPKLKVRKDKIYGTFAPISSVLTHFLWECAQKKPFHHTHPLVTVSIKCPSSSTAGTLSISYLATTCIGVVARGEVVLQKPTWNDFVSTPNASLETFQASCRTAVNIIHKSSVCELARRDWLNVWNWKTFQYFFVKKHN